MLPFSNQHALLSALISFILIVHSHDSHGKECLSMDIRNKPDSFSALENCTVIKGSLMIVLMTESNFTEKDFKQYSFPQLKEITEFMIVYQVNRLTTLRNLFPNLVLIRGEKLFLNYALSIDDNPNLNDIGLVSLISIQRGHVYINRCPGLCFVNTVSWANITQSLGTNVMKHVDNNTCPSRNSCRGCRDDRCWSSKDCQKFKDDNLLNFMTPIKCHPLCLGGCKNSSAAGCNVCVGISDHGECVEKCPSNKLLIPEYYRCYTREECVSFERFIHQGECLKTCPAGYTSTENSSNDTNHISCIRCKEKCPKICEATSVQHLSDAERLEGCTIINGTLEIRITNRISEGDLKQHLSSIEDIHGFLKISATTSITSLSFLGGLKKIHGHELEYKIYALVIYYNQNLVDLWLDENNEQKLILARGGMFIHSNYKLCFLKIRQFQNNTLHDRSLDFIPKSDVEPSCNPVKLETSFQVLGVDIVSIRWREVDKVVMDEAKNETEYILFYTDNSLKNKSRSRTVEECYQDIWMTQLILQKGLHLEDGFFVYNLTNLKQYTQYSFYVKSYRTKDKGDNFIGSESKILNFTTKADIPFQQYVKTASKTVDSLTISWRQQVNEHERIDYYIIDLFQQPDKKEVLDTRDYCLNPLTVDLTSAEMKSSQNCCADQLSHYDDFSFRMKIGKQFECSLSLGNDCQPHRYSYHLSNSPDETHSSDQEIDKWPIPPSETFLQSLIFLTSKEKKYTITGLRPYKLYIIHLYACNNITKCGQYALHSDRTSPDPEADRVHLKASSTDHYQMELMFDEPTSPNGLTVAYSIHVKPASCDKDSCIEIKCITRLDHELSHFRYVVNLTRSVYYVQVRSISLAGPGPYSEWIEVDLSKRTVSWIWYVLTVLAAAALMHMFVRWRKKAERIPASALIRYRYTDQDELLLNYLNE